LIHDDSLPDSRVEGESSDFGEFEEGGVEEKRIINVRVVWTGF
jgi:hypothetical protein